MTLDEIYNVAMFHSFGSTPPSAEIVTYYQAATEGIISNIHRKIQEDFNYWFMEATDTIAIIAGSAIEDLPERFKTEYRDGFCIIDPTTGYFHKPMTKISYADALRDFPDRTTQSGWPTHYTIVYTSGTGDQIMLYPTSDDAANISVHFYQYLARPTTFATHTDILTEEAADLIIYKTVAEIEVQLENDKAKIQNYLAKAQAEEDRLKRKDKQRKLGNNAHLDYVSE